MKQRRSVDGLSIPDLAKDLGVAIIQSGFKAKIRRPFSCIGQLNIEFEMPVSIIIHKRCPGKKIANVSSRPCVQPHRALNAAQPEEILSFKIAAVTVPVYLHSNSVLPSFQKRCDIKFCS